MTDDIRNRCKAGNLRGLKRPIYPFTGTAAVPTALTGSVVKPSFRGGAKGGRSPVDPPKPLRNGAVDLYIRPGDWRIGEPVRIIVSPPSACPTLC